MVHQMVCSPQASRRPLLPQYIHHTYITAL